jgi:hypothetical protein
VKASNLTGMFVFSTASRARAVEINGTSEPIGIGGLSFQGYGCTGVKVPSHFHTRESKNVGAMQMLFGTGADIKFLSLLQI